MGSLRVNDLSGTQGLVNLLRLEEQSHLLGKKGSFLIQRPVGTHDFQQLILEHGKEFVLSNLGIELCQKNEAVVKSIAATAKQRLGKGKRQLGGCLVGWCKESGVVVLPAKSLRNIKLTAIASSLSHSGSAQKRGIDKPRLQCSSLQRRAGRLAGVVPGGVEITYPVEV